jgi:hypothetical protein
VEDYVSLGNLVDEVVAPIGLSLLVQLWCGQVFAEVGAIGDLDPVDLVRG